MIVKKIWAGEARFDPRRQHGAQTGAQIVDKLAARHFFVRVYTWTIGIYSTTFALLLGRRNCHTYTIFCGCEHLFRVGKVRLLLHVNHEIRAEELLWILLFNFCICLSLFTCCQVAAAPLSFCILLPSHCYLILIDTMACKTYIDVLFHYDGIAGTTSPMFHPFSGVWRST